MQINYAGKISKEDFLKAVLLNNPHLKFQRWIFGVILTLVVFSVVVTFVINPNPAMKKSFSYLLPGLAVPLVILTYPWWIPYLQLSAYDQKGNLYRNNVFGTIDDAGITINTAEIMSSFHWNVFIKYKLSKDLLLLYQNKHCFNLFKPDMFSSQDEWEKFVILAKNKILGNPKHA